MSSAGNAGRALRAAGVAARNASASHGSRRAWTFLNGCVAAPKITPCHPDFPLRLPLTPCHRLEITKHEIERVCAIHALQIAAEFPEQPVVENDIHHLGVQLRRAASAARRFLRPGARSTRRWRADDHPRPADKAQNRRRLTANQLRQRSGAGARNDQIRRRHQFRHPIAEGVNTAESASPALRFQFDHALPSLAHSGDT